MTSPERIEIESPEIKVMSSVPTSPSPASQHSLVQLSLAPLSSGTASAPPTSEAPLTGKEYWRSLDELADTPEFRNWIHREFPEDATAVLDGQSRRKVLKVMAASFGLAGMAACRRPVDHILPASRGIESFIPGKALFYSSVFAHQGEAMGILVEVNDGRPTKIEGNPDHPYSLGATSALGQASVLGVYDPDRAQQVMESGQTSSWDSFRSFASQSLSASSLGTGDSLRFLSCRIHSPSYQAIKAEALRKFPKAKWVEFDSFSPENCLAGTMLAFGQPLTPHYAFDKAAVVVSLEHDFLGVDCGTVLPTRQFSSRRQLSEENSTLNRLYVIESQFTLTGSNADHRLRLKPSEVTQFAADLAAAVQGSAAGSGPHGKWLAAVAKDLKANQGKSIVLAGPTQPAAVHALAFAINEGLGNIGTTITFSKPVQETENSGVAALKLLAQEIDGGRIKTVVILGGNPVFTAPYDLHLGESIKKVANSVYLGPELNETAVIAKWQLPEAHYLESWGDALSLDGTAAIQQPMIAPIYDGKSQSEFVAELIGYKDQRGIDIVSNYWKSQLGPSGTSDAWNKALNDGVIRGRKSETVTVKLDAAKVSAAAASLPKPSSNLEVSFRPSYTIGDGSYANNAWCQELSDPITKLVWGNAALISSATAKKLNMANREIVALKRGDFIVKMPISIQPGHADDAVTVILGYGRDKCGHVGSGVGYDGHPLRTTNSFFTATDITIEKAGGRLEALATTQNHNLMEGRPIVRYTSLANYKQDPDVIKAMSEVPELFELYPEKRWDTGNQWGMAIDLTACTGCNACIVACQAENNIPVVGKDQVERGREMHWIRLDRYYTGDDIAAQTPDEQISEAKIVHQPVPCMQCENAPCENVCPVAATVHDEEGLNAMTYNRCVGTRYCMNNCPYKVRRFNFLNWRRGITEVEKMVYNPDVTVRSRGVMEKCTYCVQRIQEAKITAKTSGRRPDDNNRIQYADLEIQTACQQTCPASAIVFGDLSDSNSKVSKLKTQERNYAMLAELNVRPRTTYLAQVRNYNSELA